MFFVPNISKVTHEKYSEVRHEKCSKCECNVTLIVNRLFWALPVELRTSWWGGWIGSAILHISQKFGQGFPCPGSTVPYRPVTDRFSLQNSSGRIICTNVVSCVCVCGRVYSSAKQ